MTDRGAVDAVIERLALEAYADQRAGTLSLGNLQRLALARALLPAPELLVLDEPANGLDPAGVIEIRELIRALATEHGVTVFMSSHILGEVDRLATRIGIVHRGRLVEELDRDALERHRDRRLEVEAQRPRSGRGCPPGGRPDADASRARRWTRHARAARASRARCAR